MKVNMPDLFAWLDRAGIEYNYSAGAAPAGEIGNLNFNIEVFDAKDETAIRLKWTTEE